MRACSQPKFRANRVNNMIRHMVFFAFNPAAGETERYALLDALANLPNQFTDMKDFQLGANVSRRDDRFSHGMTMRFETLDQLENYLTSELHERFVIEQFKPVIAHRAIVSFVEERMKDDKL